MRYLIIIFVIGCLQGCAKQALVSDVVQLTFSQEFEKAGEAYFSFDRSRIIFQAIPVEKGNDVLNDRYSMYVGDVQMSGNRIVGLSNIIRVSPPLSANTCGWFYPDSANRIIYGTTGGPIATKNSPGYQRDSKDYRWEFPPEMNIVEAVICKENGESKVQIGDVLAENNQAYLAEGSISPDGRYLLYTSMETGDGDIYVKDIKSEKVIKLVVEPGYDGGPFFNFAGDRICYRSDRLGNDLLQIYVKDLIKDSSGAIVGAKNEKQLTLNNHVNWAPFWHPNGRVIFYASSAIGHQNYEVFAVSANGGTPLRVTYFEGFDGLPTLDGEGKWLLWTKHDAKRRSQVFVGRLSSEVAKKVLERN